ncbi:hypothetical protein F4805DRAFT_453094 [Annulohypoxylon moriforme]|nr:hypothetical protein F4805DRAFT_453094 [Annulohypoxylon moriforme]
MSISTLPSETLSLILEFLADQDLGTLLLAQRVCKRFQASIQHILVHHSSSKQYTANSDSNHDSALTAMNPLLRDHFASIVDTTTVPASPPRSKHPGMETCFPDEVFYNLPWAGGGKNKSRRDEKGRFKKETRTIPTNGDMRENPHLRPDASWRRLSVTWGMDPGIKRVDVLKCMTVYGGTGMKYEQLEIPSLEPSGGDVDMNGGEGKQEEGVLTMGLLYDLMASGQGHMGNYVTRHWRLMFGCRLSCYDDLLKVSQRSRYPTEDMIMSNIVRDEGSAVLYVRAHRGCTVSSYMGLRIGEENKDDLNWEPEALGGLPIVLLQWQGPIHWDYDYDDSEEEEEEKEDDDDDDEDGL